MLHYIIIIVIEITFSLSNGFVRFIIQNSIWLENHSYIYTVPSVKNTKRTVIYIYGRRQSVLRSCSLRNNHDNWQGPTQFKPLETITKYSVTHWYRDRASTNTKGRWPSNLMHNMNLRLKICANCIDMWVSIIDATFDGAEGYVLGLCNKWIVLQLMLPFKGTAPWSCNRKPPFYMMTSSNGNIFRVIGPLCGEFTGHRWRPLTQSFHLCLNKRLRKKS